MMMCLKSGKYTAIILFMILLFTGGCKTPFTPAEEFPVIWVSTFNFSFSCQEIGPNPVSQVLQVKNSGPGTLSYTIKDDANFYDVDWLNIAPTNGVSSGQLVEHTLTINKAGMSARDQDYTAKITVTSTEATNSPLTVDVSLKIEEEPPPEIKVTPKSMTFSAKQGAVSNPASQTLNIQNIGQQTLSYTISDDVPWLEVSPTSGNSKGQTRNHTVSVNLKGLGVGNHTGTITIADPNASNSPQTVGVTLVIAKKPPPQIFVTPSSLSFSAQEGGPNPSSQAISIRNNGEGTLDYRITKDADWLRVNPGRGTSTGQDITHTVSVEIAGLGKGTYSGNLIISDSEAVNSPQMVEVTLVLAEQPPPEIDVSPASLTFGAKEGGANPDPQNIRVRNSGQGTLNYRISDDAGWLSVSPTTGSSTGQDNNHSVSVNTSGLSKGTYTGKITVNEASSSRVRVLVNPKTVDVTLVVSETPPPQIGLSASSLSFSAQEGGSNPASQKLLVKNLGEGTLNYSISDDVEWMSVSPNSGESTGQDNEHDVSVNISGLSEGSYTGTITVTDSNAINSPQTVNVTLTISKQPQPQIGVNPSSVTFSAQEGGANPVSQSIVISNIGAGTLNYSLTDDATWLSVSPTSGSSTGPGKTHTLSVNISGLAKGTYTGQVTITDAAASNNPQTVSVTLALGEKPPPQIGVSPKSLSFSAEEAGANPASQNIQIKNNGDGTLNYSLTDDADWLSVSPTSGTSTGGANSHTVSVDISGLGEGTYNGTITITDANASNSPQMVNVTLNISAQPPPEISVTPTSLTFNADQGGSNPSSQNIQVSNSGQQTLNYTISDDAAWLSVSPDSGSSTGGANSHTVSVDISGLGAGTHNGTITITDSNASNSPQTVSVTLNIEPLPAISVTPTSLTFNATAGQSNPSSQSIGISNSGGQTLNYTVSDDAGWLSVSPGSGSSTGGQNSHIVSVNISGLSAGTHNGTITITDSNASNSPQTVSVTLNLEAPPSDNEISVVCSPSSGGSGTEVTVSINIKGNTSSISSYSFVFNYDESKFNYQGYSTSGTLTESWGSGSAAYKIGDGTVNVGGYGGINSIPAGSEGTLIKIILVSEGSSSSQIQISNYDDDIAGMTPEPATTTFN